MRPILLALFSGLIFPLTLILARVVLGLDPDMMHGYSPFPRGMLAYLLGIAITGMAVFKIGRLMYRRD